MQTLFHIIGGTAPVGAVGILFPEQLSQYRFGKLMGIPRTAVIHIQKMAPGPPEARAVATLPGNRCPPGRLPLRTGR